MCFDMDSFVIKYVMHYHHRQFYYLLPVKLLEFESKVMNDLTTDCHTL